jgi:dephospho-CoA kinase
MVLIGLTGGIGSGKSTVARLLEEHGARVIDADRIGHEVYLPGTSGWDQVVAAFGQEVVASDGTIDRAAVGRRVFADPAALQTLNRIVHPLIAAEVQSRLAAARAADEASPIVIEAALLLDAGWRPLVDIVWVVIAPTEAVIERLHRQRGLLPADIEARVAAQITDEQRRRLADIVIENAGSLEDLRAAVDAAWRQSVNAGAASG